MVVDGGRFDFSSGRFPQYTEPDPSYHGIKFFDEFGTLAFSTRLRVRYLRDVGACLGPFNAFLILQGVETLFLRMERHCQNAMEIARHLDGHPTVAWVRYPGLESHPSHDLARKYLAGGYGGIVVFGIKEAPRPGPD